MERQKPIWRRPFGRSLLASTLSLWLTACGGSEANQDTGDFLYQTVVGQVPIELTEELMSHAVHIEFNHPISGDDIVLYQNNFTEEPGVVATDNTKPPYSEESYLQLFTGDILNESGEVYCRIEPTEIADRLCSDKLLALNLNDTYFYVIVTSDDEGAFNLFVVNLNELSVAQ